MKPRPDARKNPRLGKIEQIGPAGYQTARTRLRIFNKPATMKMRLIPTIGATPIHSLPNDFGTKAQSIA